MVRCTGFVGFVALFIVVSTGAAIAGESYSSWGDISTEMEIRLDQAASKYADGDVQGAKDSVNDAYFGFYEKMGFERTVMEYISGKRVSLVEYIFSDIKKQMTRNEPKDAVLRELARLKVLLREDADQLDGKTDGAPAEVEDFIMPTAEELAAFDAAVSTEGLTPEEFEQRKIEYIREQRRLKEGK
ncbi:MAG: hypothetical protein LIQ30_05990 [Planctomycetes bacterium]|nr:hypothetical protein [Planctomycetota bacterium]MCD7896874.1 hypothetical protein [Planctomycetaceae bacterium]